MTDWSAIDAGLGRDTQPDDDPDRVVAAPDGGAGGWEAFDDPDAPTVQSLGDLTSADQPAERSKIRPILELSEIR
jgi:hypothetical protein